MSGSVSASIATSRPSAPPAVTSWPSSTISSTSRASSSGRLELEHIDFSLEDLCADVRTLLAQQAEDRGLDLVFEVAADVPPIVRGDPTRVRQMLLNLVGNALKFTREGGIRVSVGSSVASDRYARVRLEVRDTGIGIPSEHQASLFEPFSQAETSTMRRYGGTGLGLAICKRLVDAMGGAIGLESVPGEGSLFWLELPLEIGEAGAEIGLPPPSTARR